MSTEQCLINDGDKLPLFNKSHNIEVPRFERVAEIRDVYSDTPYLSVLQKFIETGHFPNQWTLYVDPIIPILGYTRKISLLYSGNGLYSRRFTIHGFGVGRIVGHRDIIFDDIADEKLVNVLTDPRIGRAARVDTITGEIKINPNRAPLGGYTILDAYTKYSNTAIATNIELGTGINIVQPVAWGIVKHRHGFLITEEPMSFSLSTVLSFIEDKPRFVMWYLQEFLQAHKNLLRAGYLHMQLHCANRPITFLRSNGAPKILLTDWETLQSLENYVIDDMTQYPYSPYEKAIMYDLQVALSAFFLIVRHYVTEKNVQEILLKELFDIYDAPFDGLPRRKARDVFDNKLTPTRQDLNRALRPLIFQVVRNSHFIRELKAQKKKGT